MPQFVIEREMPGAGLITHEELRDVSERSCALLLQMGPQIRWVQSYVTNNKLYCIYRAPNAEMIRRHAETMGLPANRVSEICTIVDPSIVRS